MRGFAVVTLCVILAAIVWAKPQESQYTNQFDSIDVDAVLNNNRLLGNYINCLKNGKRCTPDGQKLRELLPDALKTGCEKCTDVQRRQGRKVVNFLIKNKPRDFEELEAQYDPDHSYRTRHADELKAEGIILPD